MLLINLNVELIKPFVKLWGMLTINMEFYS